jgi:hypothetical protein
MGKKSGKKIDFEYLRSLLNKNFAFGPIDPDEKNY